MTERISSRATQIVADGPSPALVVPVSIAKTVNAKLVHAHPMPNAATETA